MQKYYATSQGGFSIIEVLIGIFVFSMWLVSIYALLASSLNINSYNQNALVASNLAREQIEMIRNVRDSNYQNLKAWNSLPTWGTFDADTFYRTYQDSSSDEIVLYSLWSLLPEGDDKIVEMSDPSTGYRVCTLNEKYTYCTGATGEVPTPFFKYIYIENARQDDTDVLIEDAFLVNSKVIWFSKWYHEFEIKTLITDWRRI